MNSVDFRLQVKKCHLFFVTDDCKTKYCSGGSFVLIFQFQVIREEALGCLPKTIGQLFVGQSKDYDARTPFSQIKVNKELKELNGKIIECKWESDPDGRDGKWIFMRERTDKSFPNGFNTAMGVIESIR